MYCIGPQVPRRLACRNNLRRPFLAKAGGNIAKTGAALKAPSNKAALAPSLGASAPICNRWVAAPAAIGWSVRRATPSPTRASPSAASSLSHLGWTAGDLRWRTRRDCVASPTALQEPPHQDRVPMPLAIGHFERSSTIGKNSPSITSPSPTSGTPFRSGVVPSAHRVRAPM